MLHRLVRRCADLRAHSRAHPYRRPACFRSILKDRIIIFTTSTTFNYPRDMQRLTGFCIIPPIIGVTLIVALGYSASLYFGICWDNRLKFGGTDDLTV